MNGKQLNQSDLKVAANQDFDRPPSMIFVVDDEPLIGEVIETFLKMAGYQVRRFEDPEIAWNAFRQASPPPDLLISDFAMQPFHGMELISRCQQVKPGLKTILVSGNVTENIVHQFPVKPDHFLPKPFQSRRLLEVVESVVGKGKARTVSSSAQ